MILEKKLTVGYIGIYMLQYEKQVFSQDDLNNYI